MKYKNVILGAGIAGIGASYALKNDAILFESRDSYGGLCNNFNIGDFLFDTAIHLSFANEKEVRDVFDKVEHFSHKPNILNFVNELWVKHPIQSNIYKLPTIEKIKILESFFKRSKLKNPSNYSEWLDSKFGEYFSKKYVKLYTKKYWGNPPEKLSVNWIANRVYEPSTTDILLGAFEDREDSDYYAKELRYPTKGGYKAFFSHIADKMDIRLNHKVSIIDSYNQTIQFENGDLIEYSNLFSSIPLDVLPDIVKGTPNEIKELSKKLQVTSLAIVSIGFKKVLKFPSLWFYIYDKDIVFSRAYSPYLKSPNNCPPNKSSLQFEAYYTRESPIIFTDDELKIKAVKALDKLGIGKSDDVLFIDVRHLQYGNVIFNNGMEEKRDKIKSYFNSLGINLIGRFGEWDYLWSNQSFMSGYNCALRVTNSN